jgi:hypothetical protein
MPNIEALVRKKRNRDGPLKFNAFALSTMMNISNAVKAYQRKFGRKNNPKKVLNLDELGDGKKDFWRKLYSHNPNKIYNPVENILYPSIMLGGSSSNAFDSLGFNYKLLAKRLNKLFVKNNFNKWKNVFKAASNVSNNLVRAAAIRKEDLNSLDLATCRMISIDPIGFHLFEDNLCSQPEIFQ